MLRTEDRGEVHPVVRVHHVDDVAHSPTLGFARAGGAPTGDAGGVRDDADPLPVEQPVAVRGEPLEARAQPAAVRRGRGAVSDTAAVVAASSPRLDSFMR
uniref:Uncharacterized protein n=1 Tax=Streptomyces avermitilis TaxID=33903 RepID=A0A499W465_STRAX|nr:hypothetical protein SAVMC3_75050 [Streptomyces avermitilis]